MIIASLLVFFWFTPAPLQKADSQLVQQFQYDRTASLDVQEVGVEKREGASIHDISYASPKGGRVPAYLVVPESRKQKFPAILWAHWNMAHSASSNRSEFLEEAVVMARAGVLSLLISSPQARSGFQVDSDPFGPQHPATALQEVVDLQRGIDFLMTRTDVESRRIAFVGHSYGALCGAALDALDKRLIAFVFMADPISFRTAVYSNDARAVATRRLFGEEKIKHFFDTYPWIDAGVAAPHFGPASAFFQYAKHDEYIPVDQAQNFYNIASGPKNVKFYDCKHALNHQALLDRSKWLSLQLHFKALPERSLQNVPETR